VGHVLDSGASRAQNVNALFFKLESAQCCFHKKHTRTCYAEFVFLHPVGSTCHVVHFVASGTRNINAHFSCTGGNESDSTQNVLGHVKPNLCFCIQLDVWVT
jgi:hypothetical protein